MAGAPSPLAHARRDRFPLRASLRAGAVYDLALGLFIVFRGLWALERMGYPRPHPVFLFYLSALVLFLLPALYLAAARAPEVAPFRAPVLWARGGGGFLVVLLAVLFPPDGAWVYLAVGAADLLWAALHAGLWNRGRA